MIGPVDFSRPQFSILNYFEKVNFVDRRNHKIRIHRNENQTDLASPKRIKCCAATNVVN